ncbi:MAG: ABC transporter ATP-binding protein [Firmicutes bacterium]|nr:ABC transporter ATP-binding protein [Bacillota bacterium]
MMLAAEKIEFSYPRADVLKKISFALSEGDCLAILGPNGAGKSTILKCLNKILVPQKGVVYINGTDTSSIDNRMLAQTVGYIAQRQEHSRKTVFDVVLLGRKPYIKWDVTSKDIALVEEILQAFGLDDYAMRYTDELSGGELQKVMIARALAQQPKILLMDEPTSSLDLKNQLEVICTVKEVVQKKGVSAVVTMHDLNLALRFANKYMLLKEGQVFAYGGPEIITERAIKEVYDVDVAFVEYEGVPVVVPL